MAARKISVNIWNLLWLSSRLIISEPNQKKKHYTGIFPITLTPKMKFENGRLYFFSQGFSYHLFLLLQLPLPQTKDKHSANKLLLLLPLCVGLSVLLLLFVVLCFVAVGKNFHKTIDVTSINI